ncbi:MAG: AI-2E family transporter [Alphaproteobacteria bacterium]|nr:AI-2E family transporter [Alphaproteobacteria bacterium]
MSEQVSAKAVAFASSIIVVALTFVLLIQGRDLLIPIAVAVMIWYLLNALARAFHLIPLGSYHLPNWIAMTLAIITVLVGLGLIAELISDNIAQVSAAAPGYQANIEILIAKASDLAGFSQPPDITSVFGQIDLRSLAARFGSAAAGFAGSFGIVLIYVLFLLFEQKGFDKKLRALFPDSDHRGEMRGLLHRMQEQIQTYVAIKTMTSVLTGLISYGVLKAVGVDFAEFWGFIIFLLNYIPTVGSLLGIIFPALLALVQFPTPVEFFIVLGGIGVVQFLIGNVLEPRLTGSSLNISPLVVILSLALWGSIWGIVGMFLCVPLTVIAMIIFSYFERTRPIAILLSGDGKIEPR